MPITFDWLYKPRILEAHFTSPITVEDIRDFNNQLLDRLMQGVAPVHLLVDMRPYDKPLYNMNAGRMVLRSVRHPKLGWVCSYGHHHNPVVTYLTTYAVRLTGVQHRMMPDAATALRFLEDVDPSLSALTALDDDQSQNIF